MPLIKKSSSATPKLFQFRGHVKNVCERPRAPNSHESLSLNNSTRGEKYLCFFFKRPVPLQVNYDKKALTEVYVQQYYKYPPSCPAQAESQQNSPNSAAAREAGFFYELCRASISFSHLLFVRASQSKVHVGKRSIFCFYLETAWVQNKLFEQMYLRLKSIAQLDKLNKSACFIIVVAQFKRANNLLGKYLKKNITRAATKNYRNVLNVEWYFCRS